MSAFYNYPKWRRKPFAFAEWGVWGAESPGFVSKFFGFMKSHPRVRMAIYYQSATLKSEFRLSTHPRSRAALRQATNWSRLTGLAPEFGGLVAGKQSPAPQAADSHDLIRVQGARVNNLKDISVELPKRRLTVFTGVSGSGKSSLVFGTIAAESQRLINETYSAFLQGFMPTLARPEVDAPRRA